MKSGLDVKFCLPFSISSMICFGSFKVSQTFLVAYCLKPGLLLFIFLQLWTKLQNVGAELVALGKSLSDKSRNCYQEQVITNYLLMMLLFCATI